MDEPKQGGFLSGYAGNGAQRAGRWLVDRMLPGDQRAADGTLNNSAVLKGLGLAAGTVGLNLVAPGVGTLAGKIGANYMDTGNLVPLGTGPLAYLMGKGQQQVFGPALENSQQAMQAQILSRNPELASLIGQSPTATAMGPVTRQQIGFPSNDVGQYAMAQPAMNMPTMPAVQAQAPWSGSLAQSNPFGGSYGGNLGFGGGNRPIGGNLSYGGGRAGYNNGAGAGTGFGGASFANDSWGDVASSFGVGSSSMGSRMPDMIARYSRV